LKFPTGISNITNQNTQDGLTMLTNKINYNLFNGVEEEGIVKLFNSLRKSDLNYIFNSNVYSNFVPNWKGLREMHNKIDNIFNTYTKLTKLFKSIKNKSKIKDNNRRKFFLNRIYYPY
jgi:hypothetical protein